MSIKQEYCFANNQKHTVWREIEHSLFMKYTAFICINKQKKR